MKASTGVLKNYESMGTTFPDGYFWLIDDDKGDVKWLEAQRMKGQGNTQTPNNYGVHWIVKFPNTPTGKFYDPSYGKGEYDAPKDYEDDAIPGFFDVVGQIRCTKKNTVGTAELKYQHDPDRE